MRVRAAILFCLVTAGCANAPAQIRRMDEVSIRHVPDHDLCFAVALAMNNGRPAHNAQVEMQRRSIKCTAEIAENVSDCSGLTIVNPDQDPVQENSGGYYVNRAHFSVKNDRDRPANFRIIWRDSVSPLLIISANTQESFDLAAGISSPVGRNGALKPTRARLQDCTLARGYSSREIRW